MVQGNASFNARLSRIAQNNAASTGRMRLHVGEREMLVRSVQSVHPNPSRVRRGLKNLLYLLCFPGAFAVGAIAFVVVMVVRVKLLPSSEIGIMDLEGMFNDLICAGGAFLVSVVVGSKIRLKSPDLAAAQSAGTLLMMCTLHNLAFWEPQLAASLFSKTWVEVQKQTNMPNTLAYRGPLTDGVPVVVQFGS